MLTLKEPIKLNCINDILTIPQEMNEKISANYSIMTSQFGSEDLLFLLGAEMGLPDDMGMTTTIAVRNDNIITQKLDIEVINNVVNRILLGENTSFTYQDEVYISMVLQKMGIKDVRLFMAEVHTLIEENKNVYELLQIYKENSVFFTKVTNINEAVTKNKIEDKGREFGAIKPEGHPYYIHDEIYSRLETNKIYNMVKKFQRNTYGEWTNFWNNELKIAEQYRVSNLLSLWEQKQTINRDSSVLLTNHTNVFETGVGEAALITEQDVLERANAAMLINTIDNVFVARLPEIVNKSHYWLNVKNAVNQLAENTLNRFQTYHQERSVHVESTRNSSNELNLFYEEEKNVLSRLFYQINKDGDIIRLIDTKNNWEIGKTSINNLDLVQNIDETEFIDTQLKENKVSISNEEVTNLTQQMLINKTFREEKRVKANGEEKAEKNKVLEYLSIDEAPLIPSTPYLETVKPLDKLKNFFIEGEKEVTALTKEMFINQINGEEKRNETKDGKTIEKSDALAKLMLEEKLLAHRAPNIETDKQLNRVETYFVEGEKEVTALTKEIFINKTANEEKRFATKDAQNVEKNNLLAQLPLEERLLLRSMPYIETLKQLNNLETFFFQAEKEVFQKEAKANLDLIVNNKLISVDMRTNVLNRYEVINKRQLGYITNDIEQLIHKNTGSPLEQAEITKINLLDSTINEENKNIQEVNSINQAKMNFYNQQMQEQNNDNVVENFITYKHDSTSVSNEESDLVHKAETNHVQTNLWEANTSVLNEYTNRYTDKSQVQNSRNISNNSEQFIYKTETLENINDDSLKQQGEEAGLTETENLKKQLDEINNKNKIIYQTLQQNKGVERNQVTSIADRQKIMDSALYSIENPQKVIEEFLKIKDIGESTKDTATPMVRAILSQADEVTRKIYDTVLAYEKNPEEALKSGIVKQVGASAFNMDIRDLVHKNETQLTHSILEQNFDEKTVNVNSMHIADRVVHISQPIENPYQPNAYPKQHFVHKQTESVISNELIEGLERQRIEQHKKIESDETITEEAVKKTEVNNITNEIITKNMENITEVINRTLARQIGDISDKVYSQMERKLQMERARRGRF